MRRESRASTTQTRPSPAGAVGEPGGKAPQGAGSPAGEAGTLMLLYDLYGGLLTANQRRIFRMRHHQDLSLAEIASLEGVSRQAVLDTLRRSQRVLAQAERRLHLLRRLRRQQLILAELKSRLDGLLAQGGGTPLDWAPQLRELHRLLLRLERAL